MEYIQLFVKRAGYFWGMSIVSFVLILLLIGFDYILFPDTTIVFPSSLIVLIGAFIISLIIGHYSRKLWAHMPHKEIDISYKEQKRLNRKIQKGIMPESESDLRLIHIVLDRSFYTSPRMQKFFITFGIILALLDVTIFIIFYSVLHQHNIPSLHLSPLYFFLLAYFMKKGRDRQRVYASHLDSY